ncbi:unnamed protein product [Cuscuta epithymum]|uniref:Uncharacterized protein n=1 Tax=Cuscuta epithymum TaxID=186058 RepID=A0AAV0DLB4_9ASTE|nr:unnamed protein product [Cuscuta epithymum]
MSRSGEGRFRSFGTWSRDRRRFGAAPFELGRSGEGSSHGRAWRRFDGFRRSADWDSSQRRDHARSDCAWRFNDLVDGSNHHFDERWNYFGQTDFPAKRRNWGSDCSVRGINSAVKGGVHFRQIKDATVLRHASASFRDDPKGKFHYHQNSTGMMGNTSSISTGSGHFKRIRIESKIFCFYLTSSTLRISQFKEGQCVSLYLDKDGIDWLCDAICFLQSDSSWRITRYEKSRKLSLSLESNRFGGFYRLVVFDNRGRYTIIIPEGRNAVGIELFYSTLSQVSGGTRLFC